MLSALKNHWPEYLMEALELGIFVFMACASTALFRHHASPIADWLEGQQLLQRLLVGLTMGITFIGIAYSPWGKRSGAHINPAVTFTFFRLGKIQPADAFFYILFQFAGAITGVVLAGVMLGSFVSDPEVRYAIPEPGVYGAGLAFFCELLISALIMGTVLYVTNHKKIMHQSGLYVGFLFAFYITLEQPLSGAGMNPARSLGAVVMTGNWTNAWIYFTAPLIGMLLAGEMFLWTKGKDAIHCAKIYHTADVRCIFKCGFMALMDEESDAENE